MFSCLVFSRGLDGKGETKPRQSLLLLRSSNARSFLLDGSNTNHNTAEYVQNCSFFHCCSLPSSPLRIHFQLHTISPCSSSVVSPPQLLLRPRTPSFQNNHPPNTLVNSFHKPDLQPTMRLAQDRTRFLVHWFLITSAASPFGAGSFPLGNNKEGILKPRGFVSKIPNC